MNSAPHRLGALLAQLPPLRGLLPLVLGIAAWQAFGPEQSPYFPPPSHWWTGVADLAQPRTPVAGDRPRRS